MDRLIILWDSCIEFLRVSLELGGKSPDIVFADADIESAIPGAAMAAFANSGQICSAGTRLFVEQRVYDEFVDRVARFGKGLRVGNGLDPETQIGPLVSEQQLERVAGYISLGRQEGARALVRTASMDLSSHVTASEWTPSLRMLPSVIGRNGSGEEAAFRGVSRVAALLQPSHLE